MTHRSRKAVKLPHHNTIEPAPVRFGHQSIQLRTFLFRAGDPDIDILAGDGPAAALGVLPKLARLHCRVLAIVGCAHACVDRDSHCFSPFTNRSLSFLSAAETRSECREPIATARTCDGSIPSF